MKQLKISKDTPQGNIEIEIGINGKMIAIKKKESSDYANQFIAAYRQKGAIVMDKGRYIVVNIFPPGTTTAKVGQVEIDLEHDSDLVVENKLVNFYIDTYSKAGFKVE